MATPGPESTVKPNETGPRDTRKTSHRPCTTDDGSTSISRDLDHVLLDPSFGVEIQVS